MATTTQTFSKSETQPMPPRHVLIIDDDQALLGLLKQALTQAGYAVLIANNGIDGLQQVYAQQPDLVVLDILMPRMDGWETCTRIREMSPVPIIILTARDDEADKVKGFQCGADDYVIKPFSFAELTARIDAVLRRSQPAHATKRRLYTRDDLCVDLDGRRVIRKGKVIELTPTEFRLLSYLAENAGRVLSKEQLLNAVWGYGHQQQVGYVKRYIWYLRHKIEDDPLKPCFIRTVRGFGYTFPAE